MKAFAIGLVTLILVFGLTARPGAAQVVHRWSFDVDARDSVGTADGTLLGGAVVPGGRVELDGIGAYVELPIGGTIAGLTNATFETWVTWDIFQDPWSRVFDFGSSTTVNMFLTPRNGRLDEGPATDTLRFAITGTGVGGEQQINSPNQFPVGAETHVAVTIDADNDIGRLYVNGNLVATRLALTLSPADLGNTTNNWLGRSPYADPYFDGSISEFRIYETALSGDDIATSFQLGPDQLVPEPSAVALASVGLWFVVVGSRRYRRSPLNRSSRYGESVRQKVPDTFFVPS